MRRRDRRRTWGLWGDFTPIADRDLRLEVDERTLADGSVRVPVDEAAVRAAALTLRERGAQALAIFFINAYANPENEAPRARRRPRGVAEPARLRLAPGAARDPRVRARLDHRAQRLSAAGGRRLSRTSRQRACRATLRRAIPHRAVERRRDVDRNRASAAGAHRAVGSGGRRHRRRGDRARRRLPQRHHLRPRRHLVRRLGGGRRQDRARRPDHGRFRPGDPHPDGGDHHHRRRRRLDRRGRSRRAVAGRAGERRLGAGAGLLRPWQYAADLDRRPGRARPHQCRAPDRRDAARCCGGARRHRHACRRAARPRRMQAAEAIVRVAEARMAGAIRLVSIERGHDPAKFAAMPFGEGARCMRAR